MAAKSKNKQEPKANIVEATGVATSAKDPTHAKVVEHAMSQAILKCLAEGITDPNEQRKRILAARESVRKG